MLDKILEYTRRTVVLDTRHYADTREITALLMGLAIPMLRVFPKRNGNQTGVGMYHPINGSAVVISDMDEATAHVESGKVELAVLHTIDPPFEHYDCLCFTGHEMHFSEISNERVLECFDNSVLAKAMISGNSLSLIHI